MHRLSNQLLVVYCHMTTRHYQSSYSKQAGSQPRFHSWGVQFLGQRYYCPSPEKIRKVYPVWLGIPYLTRSTQPCIPLGSLNRVPASAGVRAGMLPLPGGR